MDRSLEQLVEHLFVCHAENLSATYRLPPPWYASKSDSLIAFLVAFSYTEMFTGSTDFVADVRWK